jgi:hypothetical protein
MIKKRLLITGIIAVFAASFTLFFVFDKMEALEQTCSEDSGNSMLCEQFEGLGLSRTAVGFAVFVIILVIVATVYTMLSSTS